MIDDASMDAKCDDFAKRDGPTERRTERQTRRLIGMRWTHPKRKDGKKKERKEGGRKDGNLKRKKGGKKKQRTEGKVKKKELEFGRGVQTTSFG